MRARQPVHLKHYLDALHRSHGGFGQHTGDPPCNEGAARLAVSSCGRVRAIRDSGLSGGHGRCCALCPSAGHCLGNGEGSMLLLQPAGSILVSVLVKQQLVFCNKRVRVVYACDTYTDTLSKCVSLQTTIRALLGVMAAAQLNRPRQETIDNIIDTAMMRQGRRLFSTQKPPMTIDQILWLSPFFKTAQIIRERGIKGLLTQMYLVRMAIRRHYHLASNHLNGMQIGDVKVGTLKGTDVNGNKYYEVSRRRPHPHPPHRRISFSEPGSSLRPAPMDRVQQYTQPGSHHDPP